ncbi:MAG: hypothetical protein KAU20_07125, partial [Nanoarchaeota archaeon]|nr:hypothetical protein [Nanoarchaeota archaeon]
MPINTAKQIIVLRAPAYETEPRLDDLIALAELELSQPVFGDKYNTAVALKVLHMLTKENTGGAAG